MLQSIKANNIKNLEVFDAAVGDFDGITDFVLEESGFMGHMIDKGGGGFEITQTESVQVVTLDKFLDFHSIKRVDLIKIDVEGAEGDVLQGALKLLKSDYPKLIIEVHTFLPLEQHARPFIQMLCDLNYDVLDIETRLPVRIGNFSGGHVLAIPQTAA